MASKNWLMSMFDRSSGSGDVIESTVLNITKWGTVFAAATTAIATAVEQVMDGKQFSPGNWTVIIVALFALVVVLFVVDMSARAYSTAHSSMTPIFPDAPISAKWQDRVQPGQPVPAPHHGTITGFRVSDGKAQMLFSERGGHASWVDLERVALDVTP